jgi:hypothetical protein
VIFDGPGTILANEITATNLVPVVTGAYDDTNAYEAYMTQWNSLSEVHKNMRPTAFASFDSVQDLINDHNKTFGYGAGIGGVDIEEGKTFTLKGTGSRLKIKPVTWMGASRRIIMTKPGNWRLGIDSVSDKNSVGKVIENLHGYDAIMNFMLTFNFADLEVLFVNDQA